MAPAALIAADHAARQKIRMRESFRQGVDAAVTDIEGREIILPLGESPPAEFGGEKIDHRLLMRTGTAQAVFGKLGTAERTQKIVNEFRLLPGQHKIPSVPRLVGTIERRAARGALVRRNRLAILGKSRTQDVEHAADSDVVHADVDVIADAGLLPPQQ